MSVVRDVGKYEVSGRRENRRGQSSIVRVRRFGFRMGRIGMG